MFTHILLPTDGSEVSAAAVQKGIQFANSINAKVTGLYVIEPSHTLALDPHRIGSFDEAYYEDSRLQAENYLMVIEQAAKEAGVACETVCVTGSHAYEAITQTAHDKGCDCIVMASHGRSGLRGLLLGSVTVKVLTHTRLPVLVFR